MGDTHKECKANDHSLEISFKIMIIDDDEGLNLLIRKKLAQKGFQVDWAENGKEALAKIKGEDNEVLFVDYKLPDMTGKELIEKLERKFHKIPHFITMTGFGDERIAVEMMKLGAKDYIIKDAHFIDLLPEKLKQICQIIDKTNKLEEAEEKLHKQSQLLQETGQMAMVGGWELNLNNNTVILSETTKTIHEVPSDYLPTLQEAINFYPPEVRPILEQAADKAIKHGQKYDLELPFQTAKGRKLWVHNIGMPEMKNGKCIRLHGIFQDITTRKQYEKELLDLNSHLSLAQNIAKLGYWTYDVKKQLPKWTDECFRMYDIPKEKGEPYYQEQKKYIHPDDWDLYDRSVQKAIIDDIPYDIQIRLIHDNGDIVWMRTKGFSRKNNKGEVNELFGIVQDVTDLKKTELALQKAKEKAEESKEKFKLLNRLTSGMLLLPDMESIYQFIADNLQKLQPNTLVLYVSIDESIHHARLEVISGLDNNLLMKIIKLSGFNPIGKTYMLTDIHYNYFKSGDFIQFDGGLAEFSATEFPAFASSAFEKLIGLHKIYTIGINKDDELLAAIHFLTYNNQVITDSNFIEIFVKQVGLVLQKKIDEKALILAKEEAEEADRLKSAFLANMSHEIRTPMNGILGFTSLLQEPNLSGEEQQKYIDIIQQSGDRMLDTVNDIIDISKIESGLVEISVSKVNINEQLKYFYSFFNPETVKKGIQLTLKNEVSEQDIIIKTDLEKFNSVLTNLIKNAIKFTDKGWIELGCKIKKDKEFAELEFYVKDSGCGIPKDRQKAIFERFVQSDIEDKRALQGSGLGLAISKAYAEMLGGRIWVESEVGQGSVFHFTIPYIITEERESVIDTMDALDENIDDLKKLTILVAEDDETSQQLISILVKKFAKKIIVVSSGLEAVEACRNNPDIDLILMDVQLPNMDGYEATRQIRKFNKEVIILAQTAYALAGEKEKAIEMGCNDYISKPINKDDLVSLIQHYVIK